MNFKTPFKVLTTAALIGTLSLSAVAPGAASAASPVSAQEGTQKSLVVSAYVFVKGDSKIKITADQYAEAFADDEKGLLKKLEGYNLEYLVSEDGTTYSYEDYVVVVADSDKELTSEEVLKNLEAATAPSDIKDGTLDGDTIAPIEEDFKVTEIAAISTTSAKVTFGAELKNDLTAADFTVKNKETGEKQVVKSIKVADDKKSATIEFYSELAADTTYTVDVKDGEKTASSELVVGKLAPATVEAEDQIVKAGTATALKYAVKDVDGVDITGKLPTGYTLNFKTAATSAVAADGKVTLAAGNSIKVTVQVKKGTEVVAESKEITVTAEAAVASTISAVTVFKDSADFNKVSTTAYGTGYKIKAQAKDQLDAVVSDATFTYESQNLDVAVVDKTTGAITPVAESGTAPVKVSLVVDGKTVATKTVNVEIKAEAAISTVTADVESVLLTKTNADSKTVKVNVVNQYGEAIKGQGASNTVTTVVKKEDGKTEAGANAPTVTVVSPVAGKTGEYTFDVKTTSSTEAGTYVIKVLADNATEASAKVVTTFKVVVKESGEATGYVLKEVPTEFDLKTANATATNNTITPELWTADADGLAVDESDDVKFSVDNSAVTVAADGSSITAIDASKLKVGDTFTITAKVGPNKVAEQTVTVVDTTTQYAADFTQYTVTATEAADLVGALTGKVTVKADGKALAEDKVGDVTAVELVSTDTDVVANDGTITAPVKPASDATVQVLVKSITVKIDNVAKVINFETPVKLTVKVAAVNAPTFTVSTNDTTANNDATLGLTGTSVVSSDETVATATIADSKVKITSVKAGTATITVKDASNNEATIAVTVNADGTITLGDITKYSAGV